MKLHPRLFLFFLLFWGGTILSTFAQDEPTAPIVPTVPAGETPVAPRQYYWFSPRVSVTVPHPIRNSSYHKCFVGVYELNAGLNVAVYKGLFLGLHYKNGLQRITENKIADYNASMYVNSACFKLGTDVFIGDKNRVIYTVSLAGGQNWTNYTGLTSKVEGTHIPTTYQCLYLEPEMDLYFLVESNFGIGATITYTMLDHSFDPYALHLNEYTQFPAVNSEKTHYLCFGFGFYYSLKRKNVRTKPNNGQ